MPINMVFEACVHGQNASMELVIFAHEVRQPIAIAYPLSKDSHQRIHPTSIPGFLRHRNIHWECFCSLLTSNSRPVHFVHDIETGHFNLDLEERCLTAVEESTYEHIHMSGSLCDQLINIALLLSVFMNSRLVADEGYAEVTPYFEGYCGHPKP
ncbi:hypothetical protein SCLCIDRAFT_15463 [Scleroderma citrinum Foug A]|uniref:Uncharacterized protein n=1 Tax=Scleroderma citrinum Foug A TaxID=1036808 RepID=A0A0C3E5T5_9AGAM|nr:hypothetical protein SCLCIDRAFT_15463 [Scleroderma citrinum Foug A]